MHEVFGTAKFWLGILWTAACNTVHFFVQDIWHGALALLSLIIPFLLVRYVRFFRGTKESGEHLKSKLFSLAVTGSIWLAVFLVYLIYGPFRELKDIQAKCDASKDKQFRQVLIADKAFSFLLRELPPGMTTPGNCVVKITAPKENENVALVLEEIGIAARCIVEYTRSNDLQPEIESEALTGATANAITIHARKEDGRYGNFTVLLGKVFHVKRQYDPLNAGTPGEAVWLQVGPGRIWQDETAVLRPLPLGWGN